MSNNQTEKSKNEKLIPVLIIITVIAVAVTIWAVFFRSSGPVLAPDYAPIEEEQNAQEIPGDTDEKMENPQGGGSVSLTYSREVTINLASKTASLVFANPGKSNQDMVLQIIVQDQVLVQSGTLKPGNQVTSLNLIKGMDKKLSEGVYDGSFLIFYYHPETGEKSIVNTEIPVNITVKKR